VAEYWKWTRIWDRWEVEMRELKTREKHIQQRSLTIAALENIQPRPARVLDLCCGTGRVSYDILTIEGIQELVAVDISPGALRILDERLQDHPKKSVLTVIETNFMDSNDLDSFGTFDAIVCLDSLHHLCDPEEALRRISKLLTPQGVLICNYLPAERIGRHVTAKKGKWGFLRDYVKAELARTLGFNRWIWERAGRRGVVRFVLLKSNTFRDLVSRHLEPTQIHLSDYLWLTAFHREHD
jgi:ubiquinone/menaquinone biosynthesis C-methylase UbiE